MFKALILCCVFMSVRRSWQLYSCDHAIKGLGSCSWSLPRWPLRWPIQLRQAYSQTASQYGTLLAWGASFTITIQCHIIILYLFMCTTWCEHHDKHNNFLCPVDFTQWENFIDIYNMLMYRTVIGRVHVRRSLDLQMDMY